MEKRTITIETDVWEQLAIEKVKRRELNYSNVLRKMFKELKSRKDSK